MSSLRNFTKFEKIGELVSKHLGDGASEHQQAESRRRFTEEVAGRQSTGRRVGFRRLAPLGGVTAGLALIVGVVLVSYHGSPVIPLPLAPASDVVALVGTSGPSPSTVQLVPGATVVLTEQTRGESRRVAPKAYRVRLDQGEMTFTIDPGIGTTWAVQAGNYQVRVIGTVFSVSRDQARDATEVHVDRGRVQISGGGLKAQTVTLDAGESLRALGQDVSVQSSRVEPAAESPPTGASLASSSPRPRSNRVTVYPTSKPDWQALYDAGDYAEAWRVARRGGYGVLAADLDVKRLSHLAAAARLAGDGKDARALLVALRRRFPGTGEAADAAFLLGRLDADASATTAEAAKWFETYLAERPRGVYAEEARGRLIVVYQRSGRLVDARRAAREYLARHSGSGPYGEVAHAVLD